MDNEPGKFTTDWILAESRCPICFAASECRLWEADNGGHEDTQFRCTECGNLWWVDGPDA